MTEQQQNTESPACGQSLSTELLGRFEAWWESYGQFCRAGGGDYEKTFAFRAWEAAETSERNRMDDAIDSLTRADYRPSSIWRHYYPSVTGEWVCLRELRKALRPNAELRGDE